MTMANWFEKIARYDDLSMVLGASLVLAFTLAKWVTPVSLVHPLLLGRQADVGRVRKPGESAVYRNYGTGSMGALPHRPARELQVLNDLLKGDFKRSRRLWGVDVTNDDLQRRSSSLAKGLISHGGLVPHESNVLLVLNDGVEWLVTDLALSKISVPSFTITSLDFLAPVLEHYPPSAIICHADLIVQLLGFITGSHEHLHHKFIVVGRNIEAEKQLAALPALKAFRWDELEQIGSQDSSVSLSVPSSSNVITVAFHDVLNGVPQGTRLTHENVIAGVTSTRVLPPLNNLFKPEDSIFSSHSPSSALGRAILYTALFEGTHFTTTQSTILDPPYNLHTPRDTSDLVGTINSSKTPPPTVFFGDASHVESVTRDILNEARSTSPLFNLACRHKFRNLEEGHISNASFWDKWTLDSARAFTLGKNGKGLRLMVITDPVVNAGLLPMQLALSIPLIRILSHSTVCGPICASHGLDLQSFPDGSKSTLAHVGPPSINIEVKLSCIDEEVMENGGDPMGELQFRGPPVGQAVPANGNDSAEAISKYTWLSSHRRAYVRSNGTFVMLDT